MSKHVRKIKKRFKNALYDIRFDDDEGGVAPFWRNYLTYMRRWQSCSDTLFDYMFWLEEVYFRYIGSIYDGYSTRSFAEYIEKIYPSEE